MELYHHGILGQKWGTRNGPPYPLDSKGQLRNVKQMNSELNKWDYAVVIDGKVIKNPGDVEWSKYKTQPIDTMKKYHSGVCWDFVNYQHDRFKKLGYPDESFMFVMQRSDDPNDIVTHTFSIVDIGGKKYWPESSWLKRQGVHEISSYEDVVTELKNVYGDHNYDIYKYNPDGLDQNLSNGDFFRKVCTNDNLVKTTFLKHSFLIHHGIKGQKWGIRRYQNPDGTLTEAGKRRVYINKTNKDVYQIEKSLSREDKIKLGYSEKDINKMSPDQVKNSSRYTVKRFIEKDNDIPIAYFDISSDVDEDGRYSSIAISVTGDERYRNKGYGKKITEQGMQWVNDHIDELGTVYWMYRDDNIGSARLAERSGFKIDDSLDDTDKNGHVWKTGIYSK